MKNRHLRFKTFAISLWVALLCTTTFHAVAGTQIALGENRTAGNSGGEEYINSMRVNALTGTATSSDYQKAYSQYVAFHKDNALKSTDATELEWESCGPDNFAGRMRAIVQYNDYWYAGSPDGGLWRTQISKTQTNNYVWTKVNDNLTNISCIQVDGNTMYVGTGESFESGDFNLLSGFRGNGIWVSNDGTTFNVLENTVPQQSSAEDGDWFYVSEIAVSNGKIYAATNSGIQMSTDNGASWTKVLEGNVLDVTAADGVVFAFANGASFRADNGVDFVNISTGEESMLPSENIGRVTFEVAPSDHNVIYATAIWDEDIASTKDYDEKGTLNNVFCSYDKGQTWTIIGPGEGFTMFYVFNGNGVYSTAMTVDPNNPYRVFVGGMDLWEGIKVEGNTIYQWTQKTSADGQSLAYIPQNHFQYLYFSNYEYSEGIAIACENGIYISYAMGPFSQATGRNINLKTSQFYSVAANFDGEVLGGSQGNGTVLIDKNSFSGMQGTNLHVDLGAAIGQNYLFNNIGGYCHYSMINPIGKFISINGNNDLKDESLTAFSDFGGIQRLVLYRWDDQVPQDMSYWLKKTTHYKAIEDSASYITPSILWENFNWPYSTDSVEYSDTVSHYAGETIIARSTNGRYPIEYVLDRDLPMGESMMVPDKVASRFFIGVKNIIFMTKHASNFNIDFQESDPWWVISSVDAGGFTGTPHCMALSKDCNYLFVGTKEGELFKISNIAYGQTERTGRICTYNETFTSASINPYCVINTTKLETPFQGRSITSVSVNPNDPNIVVVTLGNYGHDDYVYITENAISQHPTFRKVDFIETPVYTSTFIENDMSLNNFVLVGTDFGVYGCEDIVNATSLDSWSEQFKNMGNVPVFMIRQQNTNTDTEIVDGEERFKPIYIIDSESGEADTAFINSYRNIYVATYGNGLYKCTMFNKQNKNTTSPEGLKDIVNDNNSKINVYPNPVVDNAVVNIDTKANTKVDIKVLNINGQVMAQKVVFSDETGNVKFNVNTGKLQQGTYIVNVTTIEGTTSSKFIVVK